MDTRALVEKWFEVWTIGDFENIPVSENFKHTSPYGIIAGKNVYLDLVLPNKDKFLGNRFEIHDAIYEEEKACVRYTMIGQQFLMEVTEWTYCKNGLISEIVAYYNIEGEISDERKLKGLE